MRSRAHLNRHTHASRHAHAHANERTHTHMFTNTHIHTHTNASTHTYHIPKHTHTPAPPPGRGVRMQALNASGGAPVPSAAIPVCVLILRSTTLSCPNATRAATRFSAVL